MTRERKKNVWANIWKWPLKNKHESVNL